MELSNFDIRVIKRAKRPGLFLFLFLVFLLTIFNLTEIINNVRLNPIRILLVDIIGLIISYLIFYKINRKYQLDLLANEKIIHVKKLQDKFVVPEQHPSWMMLESPVFSIFYSKKSRAELFNKKFILTIDNDKFAVTKKVFDSLQKGNFVELTYSKNSNLLLEIKRHNEK